MGRRSTRHQHCTHLTVMLWHYFSWVYGVLLISTSVSLAHLDMLGVRSTAVDPPRKSNGFTDVVQWDNYTLFIHGQRIFLQCVLRSNSPGCTLIIALQLGRISDLSSPCT